MTDHLGRVLVALATTVGGTIQLAVAQEIPSLRAEVRVQRGRSAHSWSIDVESSRIRSARYVGIILAGRTVDIAAKVDGRIVEIPAHPGSKVEADSVVAVLDTEKLAVADVELAEMDLSAAVAERDLIELELKHVSRRLEQVSALVKRGLLPRVDLESAAFDHHLTNAKGAASEQAIKQKRAIAQYRRALHENTRILSPLSGVISQKYVEVGTSVRGGTLIARVVDVTHLRLRFAVPSTDVARFRPGITIVAEVDDWPGRLTARLDAVSPELDATSQMAVLYATVQAAIPSIGLVGRIVRVTIADTLPTR